MSPTRKQRGYDTQRIAADFLRVNGFPYAEPVGAGRSGTDILGVVGVDFEVKARRGLDLPALMRQLDERRADGVLGVGVLRLDGMGPATVGLWPTVLTFTDLVALLRGAGIGRPVAAAEGAAAAGPGGRP